LENVGGMSLLQRVIACLSNYDSEIIVVKGESGDLQQFIGYPKLRVVNDIYPNRGPLGGIITGLKMSNSFYNLVVAGDMPFLNMGLLTHMMKSVDGFDIVVPRIGDTVEPLHAIYSINCLEPIEYMLNHDILSVTKLLSLARVLYMDFEEIDRFDPNHMSFFNINTENDLEKARKLNRDEVSFGCSPNWLIPSSISGYSVSDLLPNG
jgi:molybdopterin-guanine dinucleotide biosynthesis protein A